MAGSEEPTAPIVVDGPCEDWGFVARVVSRKGIAEVEVWVPAAGAWVSRGATGLASVLKWPWASPSTLERLGVPRSDWPALVRP